MRSIPAGLAAACMLALGVGAPASANPDRESESRVLRRVGKELAQLRSYRVEVEVTGGKARGADHEIFEETVSESWRAEVLGKVSRVAGPRAFRLRTDGLEGAIEKSGRWKALLATSDGRLIGRLFQSPEKHVAEAYRFKDTARWVEPADGAGSDSDRGSVAAFDGDDGASGGTEERAGGSDSDPGEAEDEPRSDHIRVVGPVEVALEHFIQITNSGCFSEG